MIESQRRAYLEVMGIEVWSVRPQPAELDRLLIGHGTGNALLICDSAESSVTRLAGDIGRSLKGQAVWAWQDPEGHADHPNVQQAVEQNLFTRVIVFGEALGKNLFGGNAPDTVGTASVFVTSELADFAVRGSAKRTFWQHISASHDRQS